jgi:hypothetical protein
MKALWKCRQPSCVAFGIAFATLQLEAAGPAASTERVGRSGTNRFVTPVNQIVLPAGRQVDLPGLRPQVIALSPNGRLLVVSGKTSELLALDPASGAIRQRVELPPEARSAATWRAPAPT